MTKHAHDHQLATTLLHKHEHEGVRFKDMASGSGVNATTISRYARRLQALTPESYKKLRDYVKTEWGIELPAGGGNEEWPWCDSCHSYHSPDPSAKEALGCKAVAPEWYRVTAKPARVVVTLTCSHVRFKDGRPIFHDMHIEGIEPA